MNDRDYENALAQQQTQLATRAEPDAFVALIERAARDPAVDVEKVERLYALYERRQADERARAAEAAFEDAFAKAQGEMRKVGKNQFNPQTRSRYASLDAVLAAIMGPLTAHGLSLSFGREHNPPEGCIVVTARVAGFGFSRVWSRPVPVANTGMQGKVNMTMVHADASAETYGKRYLANAIFALAIGEEDDDGNQAGAPQGRQQRSATAERYVAEAVAKIDEAQGSADLRLWWGLDAQKQARRSMLDEPDQIELHRIAKARIAELEAIERSKTDATD